ncbi:MAG: flagellar basal body-associated FliL family protein [Betaproteobacteria bacterium]
MAASPALAKSASSPARIAPAAAPARGAAAEAPAVPARKRSRLLKPLLIALLACASAAVAWFAGLRHHPALAIAAQPPGSAAKKSAPTFLPPELFTVNLLDTDRERYLQIGIVLEISDAQTLDLVKQKLPILRSQILMQLASKRMGDLLGMQAKEKLASDIVDRARLVVGPESADKGIDKVHFSQFIIQ